MPLHVSDAPDRLDLRDLGSEISGVLVLPLLKQVLIASVAWILVAHPAGAPQAKRGETNVSQLEVKGHVAAISMIYSTC